MKLLSTSWMLSCYSKTTEKLVAEYELQSFDENRWRELLGIPPDGDILGGYKVLPEHAEFVQQYLQDQIDLNSYSCTIELCGHYDWERPE